MHAITAFLITLIVGPGMFWFLCKTVYRKTKLRKFPTYLVEGVGDVLFIPWFNAAAFHLGISWTNIPLAIAISLVITVAWGVYRVNHESRRDWSNPKKGVYNFGGWYHLTFFLLESFIIISVLLDNYYYIWLWLPLLGYLLTSAYTYAFQVHKVFKKSY